MKIQEYKNKVEAASQMRTEAFDAVNLQIMRAEKAMLYADHDAKNNNPEDLEFRIKRVREAHRQLDDLITDYERKCEAHMEARGKKIGVMDLIEGQLVIPVPNLGEVIYRVRSNVEHKEHGFGYSLELAAMSDTYQDYGVYEGQSFEFLLIQEAN